MTDCCQEIRAGARSLAGRSALEGLGGQGGGVSGHFGDEGVVVGHDGVYQGSQRVFGSYDFAHRVSIAWNMMRATIRLSSRFGCVARASEPETGIDEGPVQSL